MALAGTAAAQQKEVMIGGQCDRTGPTQIVGVVICPAIQDYIDLLNSKGGVEGYKIKYNELDNEYKVPPAVEEYQRQKQEGAVSMMIYGTPQAQALNQKLQEAIATSDQQETQRVAELIEKKAEVMGPRAAKKTMLARQVLQELNAGGRVSKKTQLAVDDAFRAAMEDTPT